MMQIGELAARTHVSMTTLRRYDEMGLVRPSARSEGGFRLYSDADMRKVDAIERLKFLGLGLDEIRPIIAEETDPSSADFSETYSEAQRKADLLRHAQRRLEWMEAEIDRSRRFLEQF